MCVGIALSISAFSEEWLERPALRRRIHARGGEREVRFLFRDVQPCLPVWHERQLLLARWGTPRQDRCGLPRTGWTWQSSLEAGYWAHWAGEAVEIPANFGLENGFWFRIRQGLRGWLVRDPRGLPVVYVLCAPSSHYYHVMTRSPRMPLFIGETI